MIALIVAQANNRVIGKANDLPWYLPADLKHFKEATTGHTVIMGRKTYESIYQRLHGPLPNRRNIVVSGRLKTIPEGFEVYDGLDAALQAADAQIDTTVDGDTYFAELPASDWTEVSNDSHTADDKNTFNYTFKLLRRTNRHA